LTPGEKGEFACALLARVWPLLARALERLEAREHGGKIVLLVEGET